MKPVSELNGTELLFNFPTSRACVEYIRLVHETGGKRRCTYSTKTPKDDRDIEEFTLTKTFEEAFDRYEAEGVTAEQRKELNNLYRDMIRSTRLGEDGYELSVPDSMQESVWIQTTKRATTRLLINRLEICASYRADTDAKQVAEVMFILMKTCVKNNVEVKKFVITFPSMYDDKDLFNCEIECRQSDWDDFLKVTHPSFYRRLMFRLKEVFLEIPSGYGSPQEETQDNRLSIAELLNKSYVLEKYIVNKLTRIAKTK